MVDNLVQQPDDLQLTKQLIQHNNFLSTATTCMRRSLYARAIIQFWIRIIEGPDNRGPDNRGSTVVVVRACVRACVHACLTR